MELATRLLIHEEEDLSRYPLLVGRYGEPWPGERGCALCCLDDGGWKVLVVSGATLGASDVGGIYDGRVGCRSCRLDASKRWVGAGRRICHERVVGLIRLCAVSRRSRKGVATRKGSLPGGDGGGGIIIMATTVPDSPVAFTARLVILDIVPGTTVKRW